MRVLLLMRGLPGSGKSTWIKDNGLEAFTLSTDALRLLYQAPLQCPDGTYTISQDNNKQIWDLLVQLLEQRMQRGDLTVVDACHAKVSDFTRYRQLAEDYRYRVYCVDFSYRDAASCETANYCRKVSATEYFRYVPQAALERMANAMVNPPPGFVTVLKPGEAMETIKFKTTDFSHYRTIHHIGDIHGCHTALMKYLELAGGIKDNDLYIFCGDYIDRGIENAEVLKFLFGIMDRPNVIFLEGNHERWLWKWANDQEVKSKEFIFNTKPQLEEAGIDPKEVRIFYRKLRQIVYYTYQEKTVLVSHGGVAKMPKNDLIFISAEQFIKGVGRYEDKVNDVFGKYEKDIYQIHAHRNIPHDPIVINEQCFNLCDEPEFGKDLRVLTLSNDTEDGEVYFTPILIPNREVCRRPKEPSEVIKNADFIMSLRSSHYIKERVVCDISSFNFTKDAFYDKVWDEQTVKARGLFINNKTGDIVARSYDKFFNIGERPETELSYLEKHLVFPIDIYNKENGYLGLVGYADSWDDLVITSKSTVDGPFANHFYELLLSHFLVNHGCRDSVKKFLKENNCTLVFEVIDPEFDPHIIEYHHRVLCLLDIVYRTPEFRKMPYLEVWDFADPNGFYCKNRWTRCHSWGEFKEFYDTIIAKDSDLDNKDIRRIEGFVIEDATGFMVKFKLPWYIYWKQMRFLKDRIANGGKLSIVNLPPDMVHFCAWLQSLPPEEMQKDIIYLRKKYYDVS